MNMMLKNIAKSIVYSNYHVCALTAYVWKCERKKLIPFSKKVQEKTGKKNLLGIISKMIVSNIITGCSFDEYYILRFYDRTLKNQNTFLTRFYNHVMVYRSNKYEFNDILNDKKKFNEYFEKYRKIKWIDLNEDSEKIRYFLENEAIDDVILKPYNGHSGCGLEAVKVDDILNDSEYDSWLIKHKNYICEERIYNHEAIRVLNPSSLNTIRAIAYNGTIIWTGLRIGRKGEIFDNISRGGCVCSIEMSSGKIESEAHVKNDTDGFAFTNTKNIIGYQIPYWEETKSFIEEISRGFPQMKLVAWDIAITPDGPVLIEGNNGIANSISQLHFATNETGRRNRLKLAMGE